MIRRVIRTAPALLQTGTFVSSPTTPQPAPGPLFDELLSRLAVSRFALLVGRIALGAAVLVILGTMLYALNERQQAVNAAQARLEAAAEAATESVGRFIDEAAFLTAWLGGRLENRTWDQIAGDRALWDALREQIAFFPAVQTVWVVDHASLLRLTTVDFPAPPLTIDRPFFQVGRNAPAAKFVSEPYVGKVTGDTVVNVSSIVETADASGVLGVSLNTALLSNILNQSALLSEANVLIRRMEPEAVVFRHPDLWTPLAVETDPPERHLTGSASIPGWPLSITIAMAERDALAGWRDHVAAVGVLAAVASLALMVLSVFAMRLAARLDEALEDARRITAETVADLRGRAETLEYLAGVRTKRAARPTAGTAPAAEESAT